MNQEFMLAVSEALFSILHGVTLLATRSTVGEDEYEDQLESFLGQADRALDTLGPVLERLRKGEEV